MWLSGSLSNTMLAGYVLSQLLGAAAAIYSYRVIA